MRKLIKNTCEDLLNIFYPHLCIICQENTPSPKESSCMSCRQSLARAEIYAQKKNSFTERFLGRVPLYTGSAYYHYRKGGTARKLIYQLKYHGRKDIGIEVGRMYGWKLAEIEWYQDVDIIIPVPLHFSKKQERGYNQSDMFAMGLSESMKTPWVPDALKRVVGTNTQTKKGLFDRLDNMEGVFAVNKGELLKGKHILLVDDVLTTGATLEFCANCMSNIPDTKISMATIAMAAS